MEMSPSDQLAIHLAGKISLKAETPSIPWAISQGEHQIITMCI